VPMSKVKFNVNAEYAYLNNFKILQSMSESDRFWQLTFSISSLPTATSH